MPNVSASDTETESQSDKHTVEEQVVVTGRKEDSAEPIEIFMDAESLSGIPGVQDDPIKAIAMLPGIATNNDFEGGFSVRGSRPIDNLYRVDFLDVGYLFHFGTGTVVDGDLLQSLRFYPAAYGPRYQSVIGGVIDAQTRSPNETRPSALVDINFIHGGLLVESPFGDRQRAYFSVRKSYYDLILEPYIEAINDSESDDFDIVQLPRFNDYRARYQVDIWDNFVVELLADGASDDASLLYHDETTEVIQDPVIGGIHRFELEYDRIGVVLSNEGSDRFSIKVGYGRNDTGFRARLGGAGSAETRVVDDSLRMEMRFQTISNVNLHVGGTVSDILVDYDVLLRDAGCTEFEHECRFSDASQLTTRDSLGLNQLKLFAQLSVPFLDKFEFLVGGGSFKDGYLNEREIVPRAGFVWNPSNRAKVSLGLGTYHQRPAFEYIEKVLGNPDLHFLAANHYAASVDLVFRVGWHLRIDYYEKHSWNLVTGNVDTRYDNDGEGTSRGLEFLLQGHFGPRWLAWMALSYSKSVRHDSESNTEFAFEYDQPIIASAVLKHQVADTHSVSGRLAYHTGAPYTPVLRGEPDLDNPDMYLPVYGEKNSLRLPSYLRLDVRWDWKPKRLKNTNIYIDVLNSTAHRNVSAFEYSRDYSMRTPVTQTPFFVSIGLKRSW